MEHSRTSRALLSSIFWATTRGWLCIGSRYLPCPCIFCKILSRIKIISRVLFHGLALEGIWNIQERLEHCYQVCFELLLGGGCTSVVDSCPVHVFFAKFYPEKKIISKGSFHGLAVDSCPVQVVSIQTYIEHSKVSRVLISSCLVHLHSIQKRSEE